MLIRGFTEDLLKETITEYEQLGILSLSADASVIRFVLWNGGNTPNQ